MGLDVLRYVGGRVADWDRARGLGVDVLLHVAGDGFDVGGGVGVVGSVDYFVAGEEEEEVVWESDVLAQRILEEAGGRDWGLSCVL